MQHPLSIYNTLHRRKEAFIPAQAPHVGLYVCGPTVYGDAHLGMPALRLPSIFSSAT